MSLSEIATSPTDPPLASDPVPHAAPESEVQKTIYGSFWVSGSEFALPVGAIREIVIEPDAITKVPLSPPFMKGLFNVRGMTIPIVDLCTMFALQECENTDNPADKRNVAIVESGDKCVGVLFDKAGEVLNKPVSAGIDLRRSQGGTNGAVIDSVLSLDNGNRMVQTIDPAELLALEQVPVANITDFRPTSRSGLGERRSCVSFQLGHTNCAIDLRYVQEVREMPIVDRSWLSFGPLIGTAKLRGAIMPIIDLRSFMGSEPAFALGDEKLSQRKLLILKSDGGLMGLMVHAVDSIISFFDPNVLPFAKLALARGDIIKGSLIGDNEEVVMLLDHAQLMSDPDLVRAAKNFATVDDTAEIAANETDVSTVVNRKTFILFSLNGSFAMDTSDVIEVIDKPAALLQPSYVLDFVEGIINLRGELITLFNLRMIYGMDASDIADQKILIFALGDQKYAVLVDSVDEIVMTTSENILPSYETEGSVTAHPASEEVHNVVNFSRTGQKSKVAFIMDAGALVARCERLTK